jgi:hypothetical protein
MLTLTQDQRAGLMQIANGNRAGSRFAANIVLNLACGRDCSFVARVSFATPDEVREIERLFKAGGVDAIEKYQGPGHA